MIFSIKFREIVYLLIFYYICVMSKLNKKYNYKVVSFDKEIGELFHTHCKTLNIDIKEALQLIMDFMIKYNIAPDDLEYVWKKRTRAELNNAKGELMAVHNLSVGFLRTFELKQIAFWEQYDAKQKLFQNNLIENLALNYQKLGVQKSVIDELLYNTQVILQLEDEDFGKKIAKRNWDNIIENESKILNDNKTGYTKK